MTYMHNDYDDIRNEDLAWDAEQDARHSAAIDRQFEEWCADNGRDPFDLTDSAFAEFAAEMLD